MKKNIIPLLLTPLLLWGCAKAIKSNGLTLCADGELQLPRYTDGVVTPDGLSLNSGDQTIKTLPNRWVISVMSPWSSTGITINGSDVTIGLPYFASIMESSRNSYGLFNNYGQPVVDFPGVKAVSSKIGTVRPLYNNGIQGANVLTKEEYRRRVLNDEIIQCFTQTYP